ncbi:MAG: SDR family NAD(P)-dependent oxidoreductase [Planctomycetota bacterium]|jgi:short-subunit dehydrogenase
MADRKQAFLERYGPWAVVTGASSGIGEEFCRQLAALGFNLVVAARRLERLEALRDELPLAHGVQVEACRSDLATGEGLESLYFAARDKDVGLCVSNAGFGLKGRFTEIALDRMLHMVQVNCAATLSVCHHFGGRLEERGRGGLIVTSSTAAFQGVPYTAAYAATKGFDLQLAEALFHEMKPKGVDVLALCPGPVDTEGPRRSGVDMDKAPTTPMATGPVVKRALDRLGRGPIAIPGASNKLGTVLGRFLPRRATASVAGKLMKRVIGESQGSS